MGLKRKAEENKKRIETQAPAVSSSYERPKHYDDNLELDAIERLKSNILMLDDLQKRLGFMNSEIENLIGSKSKN